ncbi:MAG TPA: class I SAM-dependent methyltransferase [Myxococcota bacterium]|jgi:SAM-dependent methyltransferase|nr:class I SAM-dependent methyltransferase [Myxococcota bacterium]
MREPAEEVVALAAELAARHVPGTRAPRVLDLGAGEGRHVVTLSDAGLDVVALDRDVASARAIVEVAPGTEFALHDLAHPLPYAGEGFAAVVLWSVLPHADPALVPALLPECGRVLAHGGVLLFNLIDPRDGRRDPETHARRADVPRGPDHFHARADVDPHLWWGKIADARLVRAPLRGRPDLDPVAEWRLRVVKH